MDNLEAFVKFVGSNVTRVKFEYKKFEDLNPHFVEDQQYRLEEKYFAEIQRNKMAPANVFKRNKKDQQPVSSAGSGKMKSEKEIDIQNEKLLNQFQPIEAQPKENVVDEKALEELKKKKKEQEEEIQRQLVIENDVINNDVGINNEPDFEC